MPAIHKPKNSLASRHVVTGEFRRRITGQGEHAQYTVAAIRDWVGEAREVAEANLTARTHELLQEFAQYENHGVYPGTHHMTSLEELRATHEAFRDIENALSYLVRDLQVEG